MATVQKRGEKWYAIFKDDSGTWRQRVGFTSKTETQKLADKLETEGQKIATGMIDPEEMHQLTEKRKGVDSHIGEYRTSLQAAGRSKNHIAYTMADIEAFSFFINASTLADMSRPKMDQWVIHLKAEDEKYRAWMAENSEGPTQGQANSARTINRRVSSVQSFLKWCQSNGKATGYALANYSKQDTRGRTIRNSRVLTVAECTGLLAWCKTKNPARHDVYLLALLSGLRDEEISSLTVASVNLAQNTITVHGKDTKNQSRVDVIPMHAEISAMMKRLVKGREATDRIFTCDHTAAILREDCQKAGVNADDVTFHGLRHTFITRLAENGVHPTIAMKLARHRSLEMTLGYYTHWKTADEMTALSGLKV